MESEKWFDNYQDEDTVYLEDLSKFNVRWGDLLKRLADKWVISVQYKGGTRYIRPKRIIVTSNYSIEDIWEDKVTRDCLNRRFTVIEKLSKDQNILLL